MVLAIPAASAAHAPAITLSFPALRAPTPATVAQAVVSAGAGQGSQEANFPGLPAAPPAYSDGIGTKTG